jgi:ligand-binding sensor domain-containing protein/two-component sensor histidine kinase
VGASVKSVATWALAQGFYLQGGHGRPLADAPLADAPLTLSVYFRSLQDVGQHRGVRRAMFCNPSWLPAAILLILCPVLSAEQLPIRLYTRADGLAHNAVRRIMRDSRGFLWLCAGDRLNRFDGYRFATYDVGAGPSDILEGSLGVYWVGTYPGGVYRLDFAATTTADGTPKVTAFPLGTDPSAKLVNVIYRDRQNRIWAGTDNGLYVLESGSASFHHVELGIEVPGSLTEVGAFAEDREGSLWIGASYGVVRRLPDGRMIRYVPDGDNHMRFVRALMVDRGGRVWIGHTRGFIIFAPEPQTSLTGGRFAQRIMSVSDSSNAVESSISMPVFPGSSDWFTTTGTRGANGVWAIHEFSDGEIMIGTWGSGVWAVQSGKLRHYTTSHGLSEDSVFSIAEDMDGNRWIGAKTSGVMKLVRNGFVGFDTADGIPRSDIFSIFRTQSGEMCVIGKQWLIGIFDGRRFHTTHLQLPFARDHSPNLGANNHPIIQDHRGEWWAGSGNGVYRFGVVRNISELPHHNPVAVYGRRDGLASDLADALFEDSRGDIWIGTGNGTQERGGVAKWERKTGVLRVFSEADGLSAAAMPSAFAEDSAGNVWIGLFTGGLLRYSGGRFLAFNNPADILRGIVRSIFKDSRGWLWVGTHQGGAGRIDQPAAPHPQIRYYTSTDGLASNDVSSFAEGLHGWVYVATAVGGVDRLDPTNGRIEHFGAPSGAGLLHATFTDYDGAVWFGGTAGIWRIRPLFESMSPPQILISSFHVAGGPVSAAELGANSFTEMRLPPGNNPIRVEFFSPNFGNSLRYQYKVGGAAEEWSVATDQRGVDLAGLAPGRYTFAVRAVRDDGTTSLAPATVTFTIPPPFWRQWWFISMAGGLIALVAYRFHLYRLGRALELERVRVRIATDLHDDIGSTLSQISVLSEVVRRQIQHENGAAEELSTISELSRDLVDSLSDIVWAIDPRRDRLSALTYRMRRFAGDMLAARGVDLGFDTNPPNDDFEMGADLRRELFLIFKEAVNNAARHANCTRVDICFNATEEWIGLQVTDDGKGFDCMLPSEGNGIGSMLQRSQRLGGTLDIQSRPCGGTTVELRAPVNRVGHHLKFRNPYIFM